MAETEKTTEQKQKEALKELYTANKGSHLKSIEDLLSFTRETIKAVIPILQSSSILSWTNAKEKKPLIKEFYKEVVATDYATIENVDIDTAIKALNRETGKLYKGLNGSPYCGGKNAFKYYIEDLLKGRNEHDYSCPLFSVTNNPQPLIFPVSTFSIIAGRPSAGKTTALVSIAMHAIRQQRKVLFITTEETRNQIILRLIKNQFCFNCLSNDNKEYMNLITNDFNSSYIKQKFEDVIRNNSSNEELFNNFEDTTKPDFKNEVLKASKQIEDFITSEQLQIFDLVATTSFDDLEDVLREQDQFTIVLLDYIQNLPYGAISHPDGTASTFREDIRQSTQIINNIVKAHDLIGIAGAQMNREGANEKEQKPLDLVNLGDSGSLERVAHIAIGLGRRTLTEGGEQRKQYYYCVLKDREGFITGNQFELNSNYYGYSYVEPIKTVEGLLNDIDAKQDTPTPTQPKAQKKNNNNTVILDENGERQLLPRPYNF